MCRCDVVIFKTSCFKSVIHFNLCISDSLICKRLSRGSGYRISVNLQ